MEYRRADDNQTWHCCRNCSKWPHTSFNIIQLEDFPPGLPLCNECVELRRSENCRPSRRSIQTES